jgi:flagellar biosynthesis/type III secretory pathway protein FliH
LSRRLTAPPIATRAISLEAPPAALDETTRRAVEAAVSDAYARGLAEGRSEGRAEAARDHERAIGAITAAARDAAAALQAVRGEQAEALVDLAAAIAEAVIGRQPHDGGRALLARVRDALAGMDDGPLTVHASPQDIEVIAAGLRGVDVEVLPDPALQPGEARVAGPWARAELTHAAAWDAIREVLDGPR